MWQALQQQESLAVSLVGRAGRMQLGRACVLRLGGMHSSQKTGFGGDLSFSVLGGLNFWGWSTQAEFPSCCFSSCFTPVSVPRRINVTSKWGIARAACSDSPVEVCFPSLQRASHLWWVVLVFACLYPRLSWRALFRYHHAGVVPALPRGFAGVDLPLPCLSALIYGIGQ